MDQLVHEFIDSSCPSGQGFGDLPGLTHCVGCCVLWPVELLLLGEWICVSQQALLLSLTGCDEPAFLSLPDSLFLLRKLICLSLPATPLLLGEGIFLLLPAKLLVPPILLKS